MNFPASWDDIDTFERKNKGIYVNVFGYNEEGKIYPLRLTEGEDAIDLLLISDGEKKHYCWIKNFNRLLGRKGKPRYFCKTCMNGFTRPDALTNHRTYCNEEGTVRIVLPKPGSEESVLHFKNYNRSMRVPFVIYADFESCIVPVDTCQPNPNKSYTNKIQKNTFLFRFAFM